MISFLKIFFFIPVILTAISANAIAGDRHRSPAQEYVERVSGNELGSAVTGMLALTADGDTIASLNPDRLLMPASNMKLVTTGLALDFLGENFEYRTSIGYSGEIRDSCLLGDLYIVGGGDPVLASDDSIATALPELFSHWTDFLKEAGIKKIDGHIVGDGRYFGLPMPEEQTWQWDDCGTYYGAGISGLTFFENMQTFDVAAGEKPGDPVSVEENFPVCPWMEYRYECTTGEAGTGDKLYYYTTDMAPVGVMRGTFAADRVPKTLECSNKFPGYTCAAYFTGWLSERGIISTEGPADSGYYMPDGGLADRDSLVILGQTVSPRLGRIAYQTNYDSNNIYAETLFHTIGKAVGGSGDYAGSVLAAEKLLADMGLDAGKVNIRDGSGLSRQNLLSPSFICRFLKAMEGSEAFDAFASSLPAPGESGTMETVMTDYDKALKSRIRLKSGSMTGVKCFSGYIFPETGGKPAVFSIMINNSLLSQYRMQKIIDRMIYLISAGTISGTGQEHPEP